jgi:hypothetical protein
MRDPGGETNNPVVVGELGEALAAGQDISADLKSALHAGQIKTETYISMTQKAADQEYKRGARHLAEAMKPSPADRYTPDKNRRYADAVLRFDNLVSSGVKPIDAAQQVVDAYLGDRGRTLNGLPSPRYLQGSDKTDIDALQRAKNQAASAYQFGEIDTQEYKYQMELIEKLEKIARENASGLKSLEDIEKERR